MAPGNRIVSVRDRASTLDNNYPANRVGKQYFTLSGTSMAAPEVAGTVALMLQGNPYLQPNTVKGILMYTAQKMALNDANGMPLPRALSVLTQGAGSLNTVGAVEVAMKLNATAPIGASWLTAPLSGQTTIGGQTFAWSQQVLWGDLTLLC